MQTYHILDVDPEQCLDAPLTGVPHHPTWWRCVVLPGWEQSDSGPRWAAYVTREDGTVFQLHVRIDDPVYATMIEVLTPDGHANTVGSAVHSDFMIESFDTMTELRDRRDQIVKDVVTTAMELVL